MNIKQLCSLILISWTVRTGSRAAWMRWSFTVTAATSAGTEVFIQLLSSLMFLFNRSHWIFIHPDEDKVFVKMFCWHYMWEPEEVLLTWLMETVDLFLNKSILMEEVNIWSSALSGEPHVIYLILKNLCLAVKEETNTVLILFESCNESHTWR